MVLKMHLYTPSNSAPCQAYHVCPLDPQLNIYNSHAINDLEPLNYLWIQLGSRFVIYFQTIISNTLSGLFHTLLKREPKLCWLLFYLPKLLKADSKLNTKYYINCYFESTPKRLNLSSINDKKLFLSISVH